MIQMQTMLDVADNTGAKRVHVHQGAGRHASATPGSATSSSPSVKKAIPGSNVKPAPSSRASIVRTSKNTRRDDGSYVRFDRNALVIIDDEGNPRARASSAPSRASCASATS